MSSLPSGNAFSRNRSGRVWYQEPELWLVLAIAVAIYLPRLTDLTIRGEESRRAVIAREMLATGDWIVPRTQGVVRLSRPPLQNWLIASVAVITGDLDGWAIRLPGMLATLGTIVVVYWYSRRRLDRVPSFVAACGYASMLQVIEQGRTGETEPVFTLLISSALLLWHGGLLSGWRPTVAWSVGGAVAGLAMLTKGLQAPLYFFGSAWAYLLITRQWMQLWSRAHLCGFLAFFAVVGAWQAPFTLMMGWEASGLIYFSNVAKRFHDDRWATVFTHLATYPVSIIVGCVAPWSLLLLAYVDREMRQRIGQRREMALFLMTAIVVCFPSVWLPPEARPRYFMPLFPCFAVLVGIAAQLLQEVRSEAAVRLWTVFVRVGGTVMGVGAAGILAWALVGSEPCPPLLQGVVYGGVCGALGVAMWRIGTIPTPQTMLRGSVYMAAFLGLTYLGPIMSYQEQRSEDLPMAIRQLRRELPADARLVSFDHVHHVFLHYFGETVPLRPVPESEPTDVDYFCMHVGGQEEPLLPFRWEEVASLSVDRNYHAIPNERIVVGRVMHADLQLTQTDSPTESTERE